MSIVVTAYEVAGSPDGLVVRLLLAALLGLFVGLEREWAEKVAGVRTFALTALVGAVATVAADRAGVGVTLVAVGGLLVVVQGVVLAARSYRDPDREGLALTTAVALLATYGTGVLVAADLPLAGVTVAVVTALLLVGKRELHAFAGGLTRAELRSAVEFAILAFVVLPLLPAGAVDVLGVPVEPRVVWLLVVTVAGLGMVNYVLVQTFGGRGIAVTGFFGGLASSTAVVGAMVDHVRRRPAAVGYGVAAVLLADAAMALRNLGIVLAFTAERGPLLAAVLPLGTLAAAAVVVALAVGDWRESMSVDLDSPFSLRYALTFGTVFLAVLVVGTVAGTRFGTAGLYVSSFVGGLVSSSGATTTAVLLYRGGAASASTTVVAVLLASVGSVVVKAGLVATGPRGFARSVAGWSVVAVSVAAAVTLVAGALG